MFRFLATLVVTLVGLLAAASWWSARETGATRPETPAPRAQTLATPDPEVDRVPVVSTPEPARAAPEARRPEPAPPAAAPELAVLPEPEAVPPIPAPRLADLSARPSAPSLPAIAAPPVAERAERPAPDDALRGEIEETLLSEPAEFGVPVEEEPLPDLEPEPIVEPEERAVAMRRRDHDQSAALIRRLLDVYESLGSRR